jgi:hypothetical protein
VLLSGSQWGSGNSISCVRSSGNHITGTSASTVVQTGSSGNRATLAC